MSPYRATNVQSLIEAAIALSRDALSDDELRARLADLATVLQCASGPVERASVMRARNESLVALAPPGWQSDAKAAANEILARVRRYRWAKWERDKAAPPAIFDSPHHRACYSVLAAEVGPFRIKIPTPERLRKILAAYR